MAAVGHTSLINAKLKPEHFQSSDQMKTNVLHKAALKTDFCDKRDCLVSQLTESF